MIGVLLINFVREQLQAVLIGDVLNHDGRATVPLDHVVGYLEDAPVYVVGGLLRPLVRIELWVEFLLGAISE